MSNLLVILLSFVLSSHDFHVTHITLHYNDNNESVEITVKVAIEDLEEALEDQGAKELRIGTKNENKTSEQLINNYFKRHLKVSPNNTLSEYKWVGKETSKDLHDLYIYFEIIDCNENGKIKSLHVENNIFTEVQPAQSNIMLIEFGEDKRTLTFTKTKTKRNITLAY